MDLLLLDGGAANKNQTSHFDLFQTGDGTSLPGSPPAPGEQRRWAPPSFLSLLSLVDFASWVSDLPLPSKAQTSGGAQATSCCLLTQWEAPQGLAGAAATAGAVLGGICCCLSSSS